MLPRSAVPILPSHLAARHKGPGRAIRPVDPRLQAWLTAPGSLTARLRAHGAVQVKVLRQGSQRLWAEERRDLGVRSGHVREVLLLLDGLPVVWARSATSHGALQGAWKALSGLGTRPLAELLFQGRHVCREPLRMHRFRPHGQADAHLRPPWPPGGPHPLWARSSVFWHRGQALRVMEAFAPWVVRMDPHRLARPPR